MTTSIPQLSDMMSTLLTTTATELAHEIGLIERVRAMDGGQYARTLILGWLENPTASRTELARIAGDHGVSIGSVGIQKKISAGESVTLFSRLLREIITNQVVGAHTEHPLLRRFAGVWLQDSTTITLPDAVADTFAGSGGSRNGRPVGTAGAKAQVRINAATGELHGPIFQSAKESDRAVAFRERPAPGSVHIRDLGYFNLDELARDHADGRLWVSRLKPNTAVWHDGTRITLEAWLPTHAQEPQEFRVEIGCNHRIPCRLLMVPVAQEVADSYRRRIRETARRKGRTPSATTLALAGWLLIVTNIPPEQATLEEVVVLMRLRWRIELLFKAWKAPQGIVQMRGKNPIPILVEWYAKWCGLILAHGVVVTTAWSTINWSLTMAMPAMQRHIRDLARACSNPIALAAVLHAIASVLQTVRLHHQSHDRPTLDDILHHPEWSLQKFVS